MDLFVNVLFWLTVFPDLEVYFELKHCNGLHFILLGVGRPAVALFPGGFES